VSTAALAFSLPALRAKKKEGIQELVDRDEERATKKRAEKRQAVDKERGEGRNRFATHSYRAPNRESAEAACQQD
jgi:hypothetical protein